MWRPVCGDEFRAGLTRCVDCDADLVATQPGPLVPVGLGRGEDHAVVEYDLTDWDDDRRAGLELLLRLENVPATWEQGATLVVGRAWQHAVDDAIEQVDAMDHPGTGEVVVPDGPRDAPPLLASPGRRFAGWIVDWLIIVSVGRIATTIASGFTTDVVVITAAALYEIVPTALWGRTVGKLVVGTRVVRVDGVTPPGPRVAAIRWIVPAAGALFAVLGAVGVFLAWIWTALVYGFVLSASRQGLHDRAAGTRVVVSRPTTSGRRP